METAPPADSEKDRLAALQRYAILDSPAEQAFDDIASLASGLCGTPIALVTLVDRARQWFKARVGLEVCETSRDVAFCSHAIQKSEIFIIPDALEDPRFRDNPLVVSDPKIRFYAGVPLVTHDGHRLGTLCVIDRVPRRLQPEQLRGLEALARQVMAQLELRRTFASLMASEARLHDLLENATDLIQSVNADGRLEYVNRAWRETLGYSSEETQRLSIWDVVHPDSREHCREIFRRIFAGEALGVIQASFVTKDRRTILVEGTVNCRVSGETSVYTRGIFRDITRRHRAEEALEHAQDRLLRLEEQSGSRGGFHQLVGESPPMQEVYRRLRLAAQSGVTILLSGESGTGKELAAHAIHAQSERKNKPFVAINCSAIPDTLLESELFGHVRGAFSGAVRDKFGLFQMAEGGTLFLDEIGDLSPSLQVKLLRALDSGEIRRVGDEQAFNVNVRLVAATNRNLPHLVSSGLMREDFYYRIRVFEIVLPPLRERRGDISALVDFFIDRLSAARKRNVTGVSREVLKRFMEHPWPGNVRELRNCIEHALVTVDGATIEHSHLPPDLQTTGSESRLAHLSASERLERERLIDALRDSGGRKIVAARKLGMSRVTLWKRLKSLGINPARD